MKIGSLCSGYGGLDMAVEAFYEAETVWMSDIDKASSKVIAERWQMPNLGNLKEVDWNTVEPIDILTAGYPCQPFSNAGLRKGANDPRHIWPSIKQIIGILRPSIVILENVRGHLTLGFKEVLQDLTEIGYDARWQIVRASDAGAPHRRERLFVLAEPTHSNGFRRFIREFGAQRNKGQSQFKFTECSQIVTNADSEALVESRRAPRPVYGSTSQIINGSNRDEHRSGVTTVTNPDNSRGIRNTKRPSSGHQSRFAGDTYSKQLSTNGETQKLGRRFETPFELWMRRTPNPLDNSKLNTKFVEYMMGLPDGWVTDLDLSRAQQFKLLGNGVVPQQAYLALELLNEFIS